MNMRWLNFPFQPKINAETTLGHQHWTNVTLSTLFQRCFVNVETTSVNIRRLNFHFQPNFNGEATLVYRRGIDVILSTLFPHCFVNVETTSINVHRLNFLFQPNINVDVFAVQISCDWLQHWHQYQSLVPAPAIKILELPNLGYMNKSII